MKRDDIASLAAVIVILVGLALAWSTNASGVVGALLSGTVAAAGTVLMMRRLQRYEDERLVEIRNLSARNSLLFLLFALPLTGAAPVIQSGASAGVAAIYVLWILSIGVMYFSWIYYYRR